MAPSSKSARLMASKVWSRCGRRCLSSSEPVCGAEDDGPLSTHVPAADSLVGIVVSLPGFEGHRVPVPPPPPPPTCATAAVRLSSAGGRANRTGPTATLLTPTPRPSHDCALDPTRAHTESEGALSSPESDRPDCSSRFVKDGDLDPLPGAISSTYFHSRRTSS